MAGANNAQLKKVYRAADVQKARAERGKVSVALMAGMGFRRKGDGPSSPAPGWQAAARGEGPGAQRRASEKATRDRENAAFEENFRRRQEARTIYEQGNREARGRMDDMRMDIRMRVQDVRRADARFEQAKRDAAARAEKTLGKPKGGPKKRLNAVEHDRKVLSAVANDPAVQRAASDRKVARTGLQQVLGARNAAAAARKQQRGAESGGQMDLFSGAPAPRPPSPFERRMAQRDARAQRGLRALSGALLAQRKIKAERDAAALASRRAKMPRTVGDLSKTMAASRRATAQKTAETAARRAFVKANPKQRTEDDYRRVLQKAAASANEARFIAQADRSTANEARAARRQERLLRVVDMATKRGMTPGGLGGANPYQRSREDVVKRYAKRQKDQAGRERQRRLNEEAARRSHDFWYR